MSSKRVLRRLAVVFSAGLASACTSLVGLDGLEGTGASGAGVSSGGAGGTAASGTAGGSASSGGAGGSAGIGGSAGAGGGSLPITVVQASPTMLSNDDVPQLKLQPTPSAGNSIIVGVSCMTDYLGDCIISTTGVTDNQGNAYTRILQGEPILSSAQGARGYIFVTQAIGAPSGDFVISVDPDGTSLNQTVVCGAIEVAGLAAAPSVDAWGVSLVGGNSAMQTKAETDLPTTKSNELAVAVLTMRSEDTNMLITPDASWVFHHINQNGASNLPGHSMVSKLLTSSGVVSHTWTHDFPTRGVAAIIATFVGAAQN